MNRRKALITIGRTAFAGVVWSITQPRLLVGSLAQAVASGTASAQAVAERLRREVAQRRELVNSEEGIPMFLVCENLAPPQPVNVSLTPANAAIAAALRENVQAWLSMHPDAPDADIALMIEVLAKRDFAAGGQRSAL